MPFHAFVAMPFGTKEGTDFNRVYGELIKPSLESAGFTVFRADEEMRAGNIRTDMFQELLLADLVVADVSLDNPNVWYELGVRHALRCRGVIQIQSGRTYTPFDVYVDRSLRYHTRDGSPDPDFVEDDRKALARYATETMDAWHERKVSPVYHLLPYLSEPDWKSLRVGGANEFWSEFEAWQRRIDIARKKNRPGDILILADEAPTRVLRSEAHRVAAFALRQLGHFSFAMEQVDHALDLDPTDTRAHREKALLFGRLKDPYSARSCVQSILKDHPNDPDTWALFGRIEKEAWVESWRKTAPGGSHIPDAGRSPAEMMEDALYYEPLLEESINMYAKGFRKSPGHYYSGINALTLLNVLEHLTGRTDRQEERRHLEGGVRWAVYAELEQNAGSYWARATLGDVEVLSAPLPVVSRAYRAAVAVAEKDWFALDSTRQQLQLLRDLNFRPDVVDGALSILDRALDHLKPPTVPRLTFLFSGHMIDRPERAEARFPAHAEHAAAEAIQSTLDRLSASTDDVAICGGACGGDLLFAEAALKRGLQLQLMIQAPEPIFLQESVAFAGEEWVNRYFQVKSHPNTRICVMPEELGPTPRDRHVFARNNLWQLYTALANGPDNVRFVCLWNRKSGDGPGGTRHMYEVVRDHAGQVFVLDTNQLW